MMLSLADMLRFERVAGGMFVPVIVGGNPVAWTERGDCFCKSPYQVLLASNGGG